MVPLSRLTNPYKLKPICTTFLLTFKKLEIFDYFGRRCMVSNKYHNTV